MGAVALRWYLRIWWLFAPVVVLLAAGHVWAYAVKRYVWGTTPHPFNMQLGHGEEPIALLMLAAFFAAAAWLLVWIALVVYHLVRRRPPPRAATWQGLVLLVAFCLPLVRFKAWDELLLRTVGPGRAGGNCSAMRRHRAIWSNYAGSLPSA